MGGSASKDAVNTNESKSLVDNAIINDCVVMFSTTTCKYCEMAKTSMTNLGIKFKVIELDLQGSNGFKYSKELSSKTGARTVPQIFVNGKYVGGYTEMEQLKEAGRFMELVHQCATSNKPTL